MAMASVPRSKYLLRPEAMEDKRRRGPAEPGQPSRKGPDGEGPTAMVKHDQDSQELSEEYIANLFEVPCAEVPCAVEEVVTVLETPEAPAAPKRRKRRKADGNDDLPTTVAGMKRYIRQRPELDLWEQVNLLHPLMFS